MIEIFTNTLLAQKCGSEEQLSGTDSGFGLG